MLQMFRLMDDEDAGQVLKAVDFCSIEGTNVPDLSEEFCEKWFSFGIDKSGNISLFWDQIDIPEDIAMKVVSFVNAFPEKKNLATYFRTHILLNGDRVPHLDPVYIAETEQEVWDYLESL
jgi:hypothetical protein